MKRVAVIGAGLGGMSAAAGLAQAGFRVTLLEKNEKVGGKLNQLTREGFSFDLGPSILTLPHFFEDLFRKAGKNMSDYVQFQTVSPHWRNFFEDGAVLDLYKDNQRTCQEFKKLPGYSPAWDEAYERFLKYGREQYHIIDEGYFRQGLDHVWDFLRYYGIRRLSRSMDYKRSMAEAIASYFESPHLRMIFEYFIKYVGSSAYDAPGYMNLMPNIQTEFDLWYVKGGMYNLARGLERLLQDLGVEIRLNCEVQEMLPAGRKIRELVVAENDRMPVDYVVSNMEVIPSYEKLLGENSWMLRRYRKKFEPACSGLVLHLGTKRIYPQLAHHNFFYAQNQEAHFRAVFREGKIPDDPTIYLVAPSRTDPSVAPEGHDNIKVLPHIPYLAPDRNFTEEDFQALRHRVIQKLERMGLTDLEQNIVVEDMWTPHDIQSRYYSNGGSIYGVVTNWKRNHGFKGPKRSPKYRNLYFVGGSVNPGGGMPMVVLCGQNVAKALTRQAQAEA